MKSYKILGALAISAVMLAGCADALPELSSGESEMVAEYAAGLLLKYSPNYNYMLVSEDELAAALEQKAQEELMQETETMQQTEEAAAEETTQAEDASEAASAEQTEQASKEGSDEDSLQTLADAGADIAPELGIEENVLLRYKSFEICDSYPKNASGFSGIDAKEGKKLLVMHFDIENDTAQAADCQMFEYGLRLRVTINDTVTKSAEEMPILPDDMISFEGTIEEGGKTDVVAIAQIDEMPDSDITSLVLQITSKNGSCSIKIR